MRSPTAKECPGCKQQAKFYAGEVCYECTVKLRDFDSIKSSLEQLNGGRGARKFHFGEFLPVPILTHRLPSQARLSRALSELIRSTAPYFQPAGDATKIWKEAWNDFGAGRLDPGDGETMPRHNAQYDGNFIATVPDGFFGAYHELMRALALILQENRAEGQARGQNLLMQLNDGEISMTDFTRALSDATKRLEGK